MKKILLIAAIAIAGTATAQVSKELNSFNRLKINSNAQIEIHHSISSKIQFSGNQNQLDQSITTNDDNTLELNSLTNNPADRYRIYTNNLQALQIDGNAKITFVGFDKLNRLSVKSNNAAQLDLGDMVVTNLVMDETKVGSRIADNVEPNPAEKGKETDSI